MNIRSFSSTLFTSEMAETYGWKIHLHRFAAKHTNRKFKKMILMTSIFGYLLRNSSDIDELVLATVKKLNLTDKTDKAGLLFAYKFQWVINPNGLTIAKTANICDLKTGCGCDDQDFLTRLAQDLISQAPEWLRYAHPSIMYGDAKEAINQLKELAK